MSAQEQTAWISVDPNEYESQQRPEKFGEVEIRMMVSPYDVPEAVRGAFDRTKEKFVVEFKYIGAEPLEKKIIDRFVTVYVGGNSHRVFEIDIDVHALGARAVQRKLSGAIDTLKERLGSTGVPMQNFTVAKQVIENKATELFTAVPA